MRFLNRLLLAALCAFPLFALAADAAPTVATAKPPVDWASIAEAVVAVIGAVWGFLKHAQATGFKKALGAVIVTVEAAGNTPEGAAVIDKLKGNISATADAHGVGGVLDKLVTSLTPAVKAEAAALTAVNDTAKLP